jgi:hypothetical protein
VIVSIGLMAIDTTTDTICISSKQLYCIDTVIVEKHMVVADPEILLRDALDQLAEALKIKALPIPVIEFSIYQPLMLRVRVINSTTQLIIIIVKWIYGFENHPAHYAGWGV